MTTIHYSTKTMPMHGARLFRSLLVVVTTAATVGFFSYGCSGGGDPCNNTGALPTETLEEYSAKCDEAMEGLTVPAFDCDEGTPVPETNPTIDPITNERFCDRPNVLNRECDLGSKFKVLGQNHTAIVVAHCRKQRKPELGDDGKYGDIAVIQYNYKTGATCFYQALQFAITTDRLPHNTTAPTQGTGTDFPWFSPAQTASIRCHECHDTGAIVRSPYIAQLSSEPVNRVPGTNDTDPLFPSVPFNDGSRPYTFVGNDFQSWKVYEISVDGLGSECSTCHRMGLASTFNSNTGMIEYAPFHPTDPLMQRGTARTFAAMATAMSQPRKNPHSAASPIWMKPGQITWVESVENAALAVKNCADIIANGGTPPPGCNISQIGQGNTCPAPPSSLVKNEETNLLNNRR